MPTDTPRHAAPEITPEDVAAFSRLISAAEAAWPAYAAAHGITTRGKVTIDSITADADVQVTWVSGSMWNENETTTKYMPLSFVLSQQPSR